MANKNFIAFIFGLFCFCAGSIAFAENDQVNNVWNIVFAEGLTQSKTIEGASNGANWHNLSLGENLTGPIFIRTGKDARIILKHRNDKITIASNSLLKLEAESYNDTGILTKIVQSIGYALFDIEKNSGRTNIVETPYLVSVVKGTTFTVQANSERSVVNLIEGRLQVNATQSNASTIIHSGQIAQLAKGDSSISIIDVASQVKPVISNGSTNTAKPYKKTNANKSSSNHAAQSTPITSNSVNVGAANVIPASVNSAVAGKTINAGNSGNIIFPGNNGNNSHNANGNANANAMGANGKGMGNNGKGKGNGKNK